MKKFIIYENYPYLYDRSFSGRTPTLPEDFVEHKDDVISILQAYLQSYEHSDDNSTWFSKVRQIAVQFNYAAKPKEYKKNPEQYNGSIVHVSSYIRFAITHFFHPQSHFFFAITHELNTPDLHSMIQFIGEEEMRLRVEKMISIFSEL